jgi:phage FluMu protein Com
MDRPERPAPRLEGARCAACGGPVPEANLRVLARRDDLAFVEVDCPICRTTGLAILVGEAGSDGGPTGWEAPPIAAEDVEAVRQFLAGYHGDVRGLFGRSRPADRRTAGDESRGSAA